MFEAAEDYLRSPVNMSVHQDDELVQAISSWESEALVVHDFKNAAERRTEGETEKELEEIFD